MVLGLVLDRYLSVFGMFTCVVKILWTFLVFPSLQGTVSDLGYIVFFEGAALQLLL